MKSVIIYTMGRVGTNTIANSIKKNSCEVIALHTMNAKTSLDNIPRKQQSLVQSKITRINDLLLTGDDLYVVSPVRNPVIRALSAFCFFHNVWGIGPNTTAREAKRVFIEKYPWKWAMDFFDNEIKANIGIDPYELRFNDKVIISKKNLTLVVIKTNLLATALPPILNSWGIKTKSTYDWNRAKNKMENLYKNLKRQRFPKEIINGICESKFTQHFFTKDIDSIRSRWMET